MLITISRQFSAGGSAVARTVADRLGWNLIDNQLIDEVARRAGLPPDEVAKRAERAPGFLERLARTLANATSEYVDPEGDLVPELEEARIVKITESVVADFAAEGKLVMVGRATPAVLATEIDAIHVKIVSPLALRVQRAMERRNLDEKSARRLVEETDEDRGRYHREYYDRDWDDPTNYHMVLNTGALGIEGAAEVVLDRARRLGWVEGVTGGR